MRKAFLLMLAVWTSSAVASPDWREFVQSCRLLASDKQIADCIRDGAAKLDNEERKEAEKADEERQDKASRPLMLVRDSATSISDYRSLGAGDKGASLATQHDDGKDSTQAKVAVFGVFSPWFNGRLQPFVGAAWLRDGSSDPKKDIRQVTLGASGPLWQSAGPGYSAFTLLTTFQLAHRVDLFGGSDGNVGRAHFDFSWGQLASGELLGGFAVLPQVALLWQDRTEGGLEQGVWRSAYAGVGIVKPFTLGTARFKTSLVSRKLVDLGVPDGSAKRRVKYTSLSLDYYLYDPENKAAALQPSLFITREVGVDFLEYGKSVNKTTAGMRLKFN